MRYFVLLIVLFIASVSSAQNEALSKIPAAGKTIEAFIPADYDTIATASGDLNKDNIADIVLVLGSKLENNDTVARDGELPARLLIVLLKNSNGYVVAAKSDKAILCKDCGGIFGDPFASIAITKGILIVDHYGGSAWRWSHTHKFRYQQNDMYLIGQTAHSFWNVKMCEKLDDFAGTDFKDENLVTGAYEHKKISENCKLEINKKGRQGIKPLIKLSAFTIDQ